LAVETVGCFRLFYLAPNRPSPGLTFKYLLASWSPLVPRYFDGTKRRKMAVISEIFRFLLPRSQSSANAFGELRRRVAAKGVPRSQYFGYMIQNEGFPPQKPENLMRWYIGI
jgi:hypothetical protein